MLASNLEREYEMQIKKGRFKSFNEICILAKVNKNFFYTYRLGKKKLYVRNALKISKILDVKAEALFGDRYGKESK